VPNDTWARLDPDRRDRVLQAARVEFAARGFSQGSLNTVAREAEVAKGSLFQYFTDKLDLYTYVCEVTSERVRVDVEAQIARLLAADPDLSFFDTVEGVLRHWVRYFEQEPVDRGLTAAVNLEIDPEVRAAVRTVVSRHYLDGLAPLVSRGLDRGDIRPGADLAAMTASLLLLAPHLALAPWIEGLDAVFGMYQAPPAVLDEIIARFVAPLRAAYGPVVTQQEPDRQTQGRQPARGGAGA
jgi:AcrR family transcriptional regulator